VPKAIELPKLAQKSMVRSLPLPDISLKAENDSFSTLIPFEILQSVSIYNVSARLAFYAFIEAVTSQERKAALLREELKQMQEHNDVAKGYPIEILKYST